MQNNRNISKSFVALSNSEKEFKNRRKTGLGVVMEAQPTWEEGIGFDRKSILGYHISIVGFGGTTLQQLKHLCRDPEAWQPWIGAVTFFIL